MISVQSGMDTIARLQASARVSRRRDDAARHQGIRTEVELERLANAVTPPDVFVVVGESPTQMVDDPAPFGYTVNPSVRTLSDYD